MVILQPSKLSRVFKNNISKKKIFMLFHNLDNFPNMQNEILNWFQCCGLGSGNQYFFDPRIRIRESGMEDIHFIFPRA